MSKSSTITVKVLFFASAREAAGNVNQQVVELVSNKNDDTNGLRNKLAELYPNLASFVLDDKSITLALNEEYVPSGAVLQLKHGDTVALIPPISGG
jgi:molybdopterin converting factor small subunit